MAYTQPTLAQLVAKARLRADMVGSSFVTDADVIDLINDGYTEIFELLVGTFEDYFVSEFQFNTVSGTDEYDLNVSIPAGIFKLRSVDLLISTTQKGNFLPLDPFNWSERENFVGMGTGVGAYTVNGERLKYHLLGSKLVFAPVPDGIYPIRLKYVPNVVPLDNSVPGTSDVLPVEIRPGWERYIVACAVIDMFSKEQNDLTFWVTEKEKVKKRIEAIAANRDADAPAKMVRRSFRRYPFQNMSDDGESA